MASPLIYYIRHGETDWNVEGRLQGRRDIALNARGRAQAAHCGEVLRDILAREHIDPASLDYVTSPLGRACDTMRLVREGLGLPADGARADPQLTEISFGEWEGFTLAELRSRDPQRVATREHDKWHFTAPGGESYQTVMERMGAWYRSLTRDAVVVAHGGTARGLMVYLGSAKAATAALEDIPQGVVFVLANGQVSTYA